MYNNSKDHMWNLHLAREKALLSKGECKFCGRTFNKSGLKNHEKYCGSLTPCLVCGKLKTPKQKTCSHACSNKYFRTGENHGNWNINQYRTTCFLYHKKQCVVCGENKIVEVHHLDGNRKNNDPSNLIPMCPTHHQYWHSKYIFEVKETVENYIRDWRNGNVGCLERSVIDSTPVSLTKK